MWINDTCKLFFNICKFHESEILIEISMFRFKVEMLHITKRRNWRKTVLARSTLTTTSFRLHASFLLQPIVILANINMVVLRVRALAKKERHHVAQFRSVMCPHAFYFCKYGTETLHVIDNDRLPCAIFFLPSWRSWGANGVRS